MTKSQEGAIKSRRRACAAAYAPVDAALSGMMTHLLCHLERTVRRPTFSYRLEEIHAIVVRLEAVLGTIPAGGATSPHWGALRRSLRETAIRSLRRRFEAQTQTFLPALYGAARRLMSEPAEAEAVVTEVYGRAYRAFQKPTDGGLLKRWLFELWWQVCLDTGRRQHQHGRPQARPSPPPRRAALTPLPAATIDLSAHDARTIICRAIENLPIALRVVVILVDLEGLSYQEAAAIVRCSIDLVAAQLHRARRRLRDYLRNDLKPAASNL